MAVVWPSKNNFANGDVLTAANMNNIADTLNVFDPTSATNGQVWVANGAGSGSYGTVNVPSFTLLATVSMSNVSTATTSTLNFAGYRMAYITYRTSDAADNNGMWMRFNGDTSALYSYSIAYDTQQVGEADITEMRVSANYFGSIAGGIWIDMNTDTMWRTCSFWSWTSRRTNADDRPWTTFGSAGYESTNAITSITLRKQSGTWQTNSLNRFLVYGVK